MSVPFTNVNNACADTGIVTQVGYYGEQSPRVGHMEGAGVLVKTTPSKRPDVREGTRLDLESESTAGQALPIHSLLARKGETRLSRRRVSSSSGGPHADFSSNGETVEFFVASSAA